MAGARCMRERLDAVRVDNLPAGLGSIFRGFGVLRGRQLWVGALLARFLAATEQFRDGLGIAAARGTVDRIGELWIEAAILEAETRRTEIIRHLPARHVRPPIETSMQSASGAIAAVVVGRLPAVLPPPSKVTRMEASWLCVSSIMTLSSASALVARALVRPIY